MPGAQPTTRPAGLLDIADRMGILVLENRRHLDHTKYADKGDYSKYSMWPHRRPPGCHPATVTGVTDAGASCTRSTSLAGLCAIATTPAWLVQRGNEIGHGLKLSNSLPHKDDCHDHALDPSRSDTQALQSRPRSAIIRGQRRAIFLDVGATTTTLRLASRLWFKCTRSPAC